MQLPQPVTHVSKWHGTAHQCNQTVANPGSYDAQFECLLRRTRSKIYPFQVCPITVSVSGVNSLNLLVRSVVAL